MSSLTVSLDFTGSGDLLTIVPTDGWFDRCSFHMVDLQILLVGSHRAVGFQPIGFSSFFPRHLLDKFRWS